MEWIAWQEQIFQYSLNYIKCISREELSETGGGGKKAENRRENGQNAELFCTW